MDTILNNPISESIGENIKKRLNSPIYGTFFIFWLILHWRFVFTIFFMSEDAIIEKTGLLKNDYLVMTFFTYDFYFWILTFAPFLMTYIAIWILPKYVLIPAFEEDEKNQTTKIVFRITEEKRIEDAKVQKEEAVVKKVTAVAKQAVQEKKIKENLSEEEKWDIEYLQFKKAQAFQHFRSFLQTVYGGANYKHSFDPNVLAEVDSFNLIEINDNYVTLNKKGKYFSRLYSSK